MWDSHHVLLSPLSFFQVPLTLLMHGVFLLL
jgi:hypothetical protein